MREVLVLGAGMVGVSTALALQARGWHVTLVDRAAPGSETSFGNAGVLQVEAAEPYAMPRDLATLARIALGRENAIAWSWRGVLGQWRALIGYAWASAPRRHAAVSQIYARLSARVTEDHAPLIQAAGADNLIARRGIVIVERSAHAAAAAARDAERLRDTYGLAVRVLDGPTLRAEEPALRRTPAGAVHWPQSWSCADPGALTASYAALFERRGGRIVRGDAATLQWRTGWMVQTEDGPATAPDAVVALGPWSPGLLRRFGYRIPMVLKRGHHAHHAAPAVPSRPLVDPASGMLAAPMRDGLRVLTGAAIEPLEAPVSPRQLDRGRVALSDFLDLGPATGPVWHGSRPCMPGMLPLVGAAPRHAGLWFHFGHGHQGFSLGPTTARLLAGAMAGETSELADALAPPKR